MSGMEWSAAGRARLLAAPRPRTPEESPRTEPRTWAEHGSLADGDRQQVARGEHVARALRGECGDSSRYAPSASARRVTSPFATTSTANPPTLPCLASRGTPTAMGTEPSATTLGPGCGCGGRR